MKRKTRSAHRPNLLALLAVAYVVSTATGCANLRSFFQMSSDSPMPFFGVDFTLPPKLGSANETRSADDLAGMATHDGAANQVGRKSTAFPESQTAQTDRARHVANDESVDGLKFAAQSRVFSETHLAQATPTPPAF